MESVRPEEVIEILNKHNVYISIEQAQLILNFMLKLVKFTVTPNEKT